MPGNLVTFNLIQFDSKFICLDQKVDSIDWEGTSDISLGNLFTKASSAFTTLKNLGGMFVEQVNSKRFSHVTLKTKKI